MRQDGIRVYSGERADDASQPPAAGRGDPELRKRRAIASQPDVDPALLDQLLNDQDPDVRSRAFNNPALTAEQLERVSQHFTPRAVQRRAKKMAAHPSTALGMARSRSTNLQRIVARSSADPDVIAALIRSATDDVLTQLFQRKDLPAVALEAFANDPRQLVRVQVAKQTELPPEVWTALALDDSPEVRLVVAGNASAAPKALAALVGRACAHSGSRRPTDRRRTAVQELSAAGANPATPVETLTLIAKEKRWDIRAAVAANPGCAGSTRRKLAKDRRWVVRAAVTGCPDTDPELLRHLAGDRAPAVRLALAGNPSTPSDVIDRFLSTPGPWALAAPNDSATDRLAQLAEPSAARWVRGLAAGNPNATPDALRELVEGLEAPPWVLAAVARNPACPPDLADQLLTWLALGGAGSGSPTFDPRTCITNPVDQDVNAPVFFGAIAAKTTLAEAIRHPLWPVRNAAMNKGRIPYPLLAELAADSAAPVRRRVLNFKPLPLSTLDELGSDATPGIASRAQREYDAVRALPFRKRPLANGKNQALSRGDFRTLAVMAGLILSALVGLSHHDSGTSARAVSSILPDSVVPTALQRTDGTGFAEVKSAPAPNGGHVSLGAVASVTGLPASAAVRIDAGTRSLTVVDVIINSSFPPGGAAFASSVTLAAGESATFESRAGTFDTGTTVYVRFSDNSSVVVRYG